MKNHYGIGKPPNKALKTAAWGSASSVFFASLEIRDFNHVQCNPMRGVASRYESRYLNKSKKIKGQKTCDIPTLISTKKIYASYYILYSESLAETHC